MDGEWQTEIVRDPAVIRAYIRRRQIIEEESTMTDKLAPTGDEEKDKRARKRCVLNLLIVLLLSTNHFLQVGGRDSTNEEEPRAPAASQEREDCQRRWDADAD